MSSGCNARVGAHFQIDATQGFAFLEHDADGVNAFLVRSGAARIMSGAPKLRQHGVCM
jgi:hypothetical protein